MKGAGLKEVNGIYVRDGNFRGSPRYKQINSSTPEDPFYIRQGGNLHSGYGISRGAEKYAGHWAYFCEKSRGKKSIQFVPEDSWVSQGGLNAVEPSPTVVRAKDPVISDLEIAPRFLKSFLQFLCFMKFTKRPHFFSENYILNYIKWNLKNHTFTSTRKSQCTFDPV